MLALNNFTEGKPEIIRPAIELAELFKANLTVVKFYEDPVPAYKSINIERAGNTYIKKIQTLAENIKSTFVHLDGHKFEKRIEKYISQENIDLLVMITHKRRLLKSLFNRSMTKRMSYHSRVPLLAILAKS